MAITASTPLYPSTPIPAILPALIKPGLVNSKFISLIVVALCVGGFLIFQGTRASSTLVKVPSDLAFMAPSERLTRIRVGGRVAADGLDYQVQPEIVLKFKVHDPVKTGSNVSSLPLIPVVYRGIRPDMFAPGRDVIIDGEYSEGVLQASKLLTQCPSKYEPPSVNEKISHQAAAH
jgi:cytochrome c-type biogenesis protein CcmE